ncbi:MAG TPA: ATP-binding protein, partial [Longimicrobiaceae bacterium]
GRIKASSEHLLGLVNDILDLSKVEAGEMTVVREEVPACATAAGALALVVPQAEARAIDLSDTSDCRPDAAFLGDGDRVRQILANLLSNAVKFTEPGGSVTVACRVAPPDGPEAPRGEGPWVVMEVQDTGIGIAPEQLARVFEPFVQVEEGHTRTRGGTGLGLTISRRFARMMGGDLTVKSAPGRGSCFTLWLPAAPDPEEPRPVPEPWHAGVGEVPGLAELGRLVGERSGELVRALGDRLRADPAVPGASALDDAQLEDHIATFLTDLGKALVTLEQGGAEPELLRAGMEIRRLISVRHGEQRARLGWSEDEIRREYRMLRDEVEALVRREWSARPETDVEEALGILLRLMDRSEQTALEAWGEARARAR